MTLLGDVEQGVLEGIDVAELQALAASLIAAAGENPGSTEGATVAAGAPGQRVRGDRRAGHRGTRLCAARPENGWPEIAFGGPFRHKKRAGSPHVVRTAGRLGGDRIGLCATV